LRSRESFFGENPFGPSLVTAEEENLAPELKIEEPPDAVRGVLCSGSMPVEKICERGKIGERGQQTAARGQQIVNWCAARIQQPVRERRREAHFPALNNIAWKQILGRPLQDEFAFGAIDSEVVGQLSGELDERMIEKRHTALN
jgi:hypothetical protein